MTMISMVKCYGKNSERFFKTEKKNHRFLNAARPDLVR